MSGDICRICVPGNTSCSGKNVMTCNSSGTSKTASSSCTYACSSGACVRCTSGSHCSDAPNWTVGGRRDVCSGNKCCGRTAGRNHHCIGL